MLLILLGYFLLPSPAEGANKAFTCSPGPLAATCDAGKVVLIRQIRRGSYVGAFNGSHCKYQMGDRGELDDGDSKDVWEACNLQRTCSVRFIQSGNYYLEMDYECVSRSNIDMFDICDTVSGTRLVAKHGYIHSPCYPNLSTWTESTYVYCACSGTFQLPEKKEDLTISVFHGFQETEELEIRWHAITNPPETFRNTSPSFRTEQRTTGSFYLLFRSTYLGSDRNRGFWLEFTANSPLIFRCSNTMVTPPSCQAPTPITTTTKTTITTTTTTTTTTMTKTYPVSTTKPTESSSTDVDTDSLRSNRDMNIPVTLGLAVPLIIVSAILLWRNGTIARLCKCHCDENRSDAAQPDANGITPGRPVNENIGTDYENVFPSNFDNPAFVGDQNPELSHYSDITDSSYVNVPDKAANPTNSHDQMMPIYVNIETNRINPGARDLGTDTYRQEALAPRDEDYSPYAEIGDTGASVPGVGAAAAPGEEVESPYAKLEPVERSDYLDLRHLGYAHQSQSK